MILKATLEFMAGWQVLLASSGAEGIATAQAAQPEAILLDVMMLGVDGISLFHQLQAQPETREIPVIFLTAQARDVERQELEALGAGVILKPFEPAAIASQISKLLSWSD